MSVVDSMRVRLSRAQELGVPSGDFLRRERQAGIELQSHVNARVALAGQEAEEAARVLEHELDSPEEAWLRLMARQAYGG